MKYHTGLNEGMILYTGFRFLQLQPMQVTMLEKRPSKWLVGLWSRKMVCHKLYMANKLQAFHNNDALRNLSTDLLRFTWCSHLGNMSQNC